ncbi:MAG: hypothetical protein K8L91_09920 [Anaerolineae bacterium]|nr:hypothetical protein [Anaerolineae bacterium]
MTVVENEEESQTRGYAIKGLARLRDPRAVPILIQRLADAECFAENCWLKPLYEVAELPHLKGRGDLGLPS